jgi:hypothetical protein
MTIELSDEAAARFAKAATAASMSPTEFASKALYFYIALSERYAQVAPQGGIVVVGAAVRMPNGELEGFDIRE